MKPFIFAVVILITAFSSAAAPFDDSQAVREQYEEFRQQAIADGHQPASDDAGLAEVYLVYGQKSLQEGDLQSALKHLQAGRELLPNDGRFYMLEGVAYAKAGDDIMAENSLLTAVQLLPDDPEPLKLLADLYYRTGKLPEAEDVLQQTIRLVPDDETLRQRLAQVQREVDVEADMVRDVNSIFSVKFEEQVHEELADRVVEFLQDAYTEQGALLNHYPQQTIQVILYSRDDYDMTTGAPAWSAGRFDGKIRLPVNVRQTRDVDLKRILQHEYNHFLAQQISRSRAPAWFYEGLAMLAEGRSNYHLAHLQAAKASGGLRDFSTLEKSFNGFGRDEAYLAYEQSFSFVSYLANQFGWHTLKDLLLAYGRGESTMDAFASVFRDFGLDFSQLHREWQADL